MDKNIEMARRIAEAVRQAGGRTFYVGGYVRDRLMGHENKDIDIEIHGISAKHLEEILRTLGEPLSMGASFGIMGLRHYELDIAMPRTEETTGRGHKDFEVSVDPFLGEEKAARRRDFTMNALMQDVLTDEILDFFGGKEDIAGRRIRHVNDLTFVEDPLRAFRAAQFAARFGFAVAEETALLASTMDVTALAGERIMMELEKALLKSNRPSVFFEELRKMNLLSVWFPEVENLLGIPQSVRFHPEGDVWNHTMQVLDEAAKLRGEASKPLWFMLSALCHDFGKAVVTDKRDTAFHAYGHEKEGLPLVRQFLGRLTNETRLTNYVLNMTKMHMEPNRKVRDDSHIKSYMKTFDRSVCPEDLLLLAKADYVGRVGEGMHRSGLEAEYGRTEELLKKMLRLYRDRMNRPFLMGRDLIEAGIQAGPVFSDAISYAHKLRLAGLTKEEQLRHTLAWLRKSQNIGNEM